MVNRSDKKRQNFLTSQVCKFDLELQYCLGLPKLGKHANSFI